MAGIIMAAVILIILALISINMVILLVSGWILAYAGIFFLGFGGSRWTSEIAINYYRPYWGSRYRCLPWYCWWASARRFSMIIIRR